MALAQRKIEIPLAAGIDSETADKILPLGFDLELENCQWAKKGEIEKRPGNAAMAMGTTPGAGSVANVWQLAQQQGSLVSLSKIGTSPIHTYSPSETKWSRAGTDGALASRQVGPVRATPIPVATDPQTRQAPDCTFINYAGGYIGTCHEAFDGTTVRVEITILDATTNKRVHSYTQAGSHSQCFSVGQWFVTIFRESAVGLRMAAWDMSAPAAAPTVTTLVAAASLTVTNWISKIGKKSATVWTVFYHTITPSTAGIDITCTSSVSAGAPYAVTTAAAAAINSSKLDVVEDIAGSGFRVVLTADAVNGLRAHYMDGTNTTTKTLVIDAAATSPTDMVGYTIDSTPHIHIQYDFIGGAGFTYNSRIKLATVLGADVVTAVEWLRSVQLGSRPFTYGGLYFVIGRYLSTTQGTDFLFKVPADTTDTAQRDPLARWHVWSGDDANIPPSGGMPPHAPVSPANARLFYSITSRKRRAGPVAAAASNVGMDLVQLEFDPVTGRPAEHNGLMLIPNGGQLNAFDGKTYYDDGFPVYPEKPTTAQSTAGGALTLTGTYTYCLVYGWVDNLGNRHRSAVSFNSSPRILTGANDTITVTCPCLRLTSRNVTIEVYRNETVGVDFYKVGEVANDPTADTVTYVDTTADTALIALELLYASGGVLEYDPTPGSGGAIAHRDKIFSISSDNTDEIWYSNVSVSGKGPRFSDTKVVRISDERGAIVALCSDGTYAYAFKATGIYQLFGDGTDTIGRGTAITYQLIEEGLGTTNPQSVIATPVGIMFQTPAGIYLKPPGAPSIYVGGPVQAYNGLTITAAVLHPSKSQARFHTSTNRTLTYNYRYGKWSPWTGAQTASAAVIWGTTPVFANGATVYKEDTTVFTDAGAAYEEAVATSWLTLGGLKGWQYTWALQGVGERAGDHTLQVKVFNDFDDVTPTQTKTQVIGAGHKWDWELPIKRGMSASMKVRLSDQSAATAGFKASTLTLIYGVVGGAQRVAPSKRMT